MKIAKLVQSLASVAGSLEKVAPAQAKKIAKVARKVLAAEGIVSSESEAQEGGGGKKGGGGGVPARLKRFVDDGNSGGTLSR